MDEERLPPTLYDYDVTLAWLLDMMGRGDLTCDMTLTIGGTYVSGVPISQRAFYEGIGATIGAAMPTPEMGTKTRRVWVRNLYKG